MTPARKNLCISEIIGCLLRHDVTSQPTLNIAQRAVRAVPVVPSHTSVSSVTSQGTSSAYRQLWTGDEVSSPATETTSNITGFDQCQICFQLVIKHLYKKSIRLVLDLLQIQNKFLMFFSTGSPRYTSI